MKSQNVSEIATKSPLNLWEDRNYNRGDSKLLQFHIASGLDLTSLAIWATKVTISCVLICGDCHQSKELLCGHPRALGSHWITDECLTAFEAVFLQCVGEKNAQTVVCDLSQWDFCIDLWNFCLCWVLGVAGGPWIPQPIWREAKIAKQHYYISAITSAAIYYGNRHVTNYGHESRESFGYVLCVAKWTWKLQD